MEFDNNTNTSVTNEQRQQAEMRKLTLQPLHEDIAREDAPESEIAASHANDTPIANVPTETEETLRPEQAASETSLKKHHAAGYILTGIFVAGLAATIAYLFA